MKKTVDVLLSTKPPELVFFPSDAVPALPAVLETGRFSRIGRLADADMPENSVSLERGATVRGWWISYLSVRQVVGYGPPSASAEAELVFIKHPSLPLLVHNVTPISIKRLGDNALHYVGILKMLE